MFNLPATKVEQEAQGLTCANRTDDVGSVICLWTLSLARVWTWFLSTLVWVSSGMSGDVWLIFRPDSGTTTAEWNPGVSFIQPSSLYSLSSPSTCTTDKLMLTLYCEYFFWNASLGIIFEVGRIEDRAVMIKEGCNVEQKFFDALVKTRKAFMLNG